MPTRGRSKEVPRTKKETQNMVEVHNNDTLQAKKRERPPLYMIPILGLAICGYLVIFLTNEMMPSLSQKSQIPPANPSSLAPQKQNHCIGLGFEEDMDNLLSKYKEVFVLMPAKAAGTSMKRFTLQCMTLMNKTAFLKRDNVLNRRNWIQEAFQSQLNMPSLIASHLYTEKTFQDIVTGVPEDTLLVYITRKESERVLSAIKQVAEGRMCTKWGKDSGVELVNNECKIKQGTLFEWIQKRSYNEIDISGPRLLTCQTYETIKKQNPNLVFMNYEQASKLQKLLSKHHCPNVTEEVRVNVGAEKKKPIFVVLETPANNGTGTLVPLDDWLKIKSPILEFAANLRRDASCQSTTRKIERELFACSDQTYPISGNAMDFPLQSIGQNEQHPKAFG